MIQSSELIYEYFFSALYSVIKDLIGNSALHHPNDSEEKQLDLMLNEGKLLFDVVGDSFSQLKVREAEYKYWVEVYMLKIIKSLLNNKGISFTERYYQNENEQYSIVIQDHKIKTEFYFLFDLSYEEPSRTDYDKIASELKRKADADTEKIIIYVLRDSIGYATLARMLNTSPEMNGNDYLKVYPIKDFFDYYFGHEEYAAFESFANEFIRKCKHIISYKTVITPTEKTMSVFRQRKIDMLKDFDYPSIAQKISVPPLSQYDFSRISQNFYEKEMYRAMVGKSDFADSYISAEWSYDVYRNAMGDLELTGIIAGYLKSIEQLLYKVISFHRDENKKIKTKNNGIQPYTLSIEDEIDSTLGSLNTFIFNAKLPISKKVKEYLFGIIKNWKDYQRNGFFHKHNLYTSDNKIYI